MTAQERDEDRTRRRKGRRAAFWRGFLAAFGVLILIGIGAFLMDDGPRGPHIARLQVTGTIFGDLERERLVRKLAENDDVEAVVLHINSPGGTSAGAEGLYLALREVAESKPVVAVLGEIAASGGYIAALSADRIISRGNTLTGSIGVIMEYPDVTDLLARLGVEYETIRSSDLKAEPSPFRKISPEARDQQQALIAESYVWFRNLVGTRRNLDGAALDVAASGGVFTGRTALEAGLVDALGGEPEAIDWLESVNPDLKDLPVAAVSVQPEPDGWLPFLARSVLDLPIGVQMASPSAPRLMAVLRY